MNNSYIGIFDSGLGGLTAVREVFSSLPNENIIYFGDTGRVPYGTRSNETVIKYSRQNIRFLLNFDVKAILIACGTASSIALPALKQEFDFPVLGVVKSASRKAAKITKSGRIGVIGTPATIASGSYEREIAAISPDLRVMSKSCPLFVPLVEGGRYKKGDIVIETVAKEYLAPIIEFNPDIIILGCTHYPLLRDVISSIVKDHVTLIDAGKEAVLHLKERLEGINMHNTSDKEGKRRFFVSDSVNNFSYLASIFLHTDASSLDVQKIDIESY